MITVIMAAYNEAAAVGAVLSSMPESVRGRPVHVVVVDDGSTDGTAAVAEAHGARVLRSTPNCGKGSALKRGLKQVRLLPTDAVVLMDSDGQHSPEDLPRIVEPVLGGMAEMVVGSRYLLDGGRANTPINRYLVRTVTARILSSALGFAITDPFSGYRCLTPGAARSAELRGDRYESELELAFCAARNDCRIVEVPIARIYGGRTSKMGARLGPVLGRIDVVGRYASTIVREYLRMRRPLPTQSEAEAA